MVLFGQNLRRCFKNIWLENITCFRLPLNILASIHPVSMWGLQHHRLAQHPLPRLPRLIPPRLSPPHPHLIVGPQSRYTFTPVCKHDELWNLLYTNSQDSIQEENMDLEI